MDLCSELRSQTIKWMFQSLLCRLIKGGETRSSRNVNGSSGIADKDMLQFEGRNVSLEKPITIS